MIAQVEGGAEMIDAAIRHSWEAGAIAVVLIVMLVGIGYLMRALWNVNQRLAERVTHLEDQFTNKLMGIIEDTTRAVAANTQMLERTARVIEKLEATVEHSLRTQRGIMAKIEASPCLMVASLSKETKDTLLAARDAAVTSAEDAVKETQ